MKLRLFISYSHRDQEFAEALRTHLKSLERTGVVEVWYDRMIPAGAIWRGEIDRNLEGAHVIIILLSADFFESDYCYQGEMGRALERNRAGEALVIPVVVRAVVWENSPLGELQALPEGARPVVEWEYPDRAWTSVVLGILKTEAQLFERNVARLAEEYVLEKREFEKTKDRIATEICEATNSGMPVDALVPQVILLLSEQKDCELRLRMKELTAISAINDTNARAAKSGHSIDFIDPAKFGLPKKSTTEVMEDLSNVMKESMQSLQALSSTVKELNDLVMTPIRNMRS